MLTQTEIKKLANDRKGLIQKLHTFPVVIYGATRGAEYSIRFLRSYGIDPVACAVDPEYLTKDRIKRVRDGNKILKYPVYSTEEVHLHYPEFITGKACNTSKEINLPGQIFWFIPKFADHHTPDFFTEEFTDRHYAALQELESWLADDVSRKLLAAYMKSMISWDFSYLKGLACFPQYFHPDLMPLTDHESVVDCGAYIGDSLQEFLVRTQSRFHSYHAFEPDPVNFKKLQEYTSTLDDDRIKLYPLATGTGESILSFSSEDSSAGFSQDGDLKVKVNSLDNVIGEQPLSFLKMDIEGAELDTLKGAEAIIRREKPKMAICVYHRNEDLMTIPTYIKSLVPEYQFKLGYHSYREVELVLYAYLPR